MNVPITGLNMYRDRRVASADKGNKKMTILKLANGAKTIEYTVGRFDPSLNNPYGVVLATQNYTDGNGNIQPEFITWRWSTTDSGKIACESGEDFAHYHDAKDAYRKMI